MPKSWIQQINHYFWSFESQLQKSIETGWGKEGTVVGPFKIYFLNRIIEPHEKCSAAIAVNYSYQLHEVHEPSKSIHHQLALTLKYNLPTTPYKHFSWFLPLVLSIDFFQHANKMMRWNNRIFHYPIRELSKGNIKKICIYTGSIKMPQYFHGNGLSIRFDISVSVKLKLILHKVVSGSFPDFRLV